MKNQKIIVFLLFNELKSPINSININNEIIQRWEDSFNYHLSSLHISIENTFGIFIQRWGILWRALCCDLVEVTKILVSCVH